MKSSYSQKRLEKDVKKYEEYKKNLKDKKVHPEYDLLDGVVYDNNNYGNKESRKRPKTAKN